MPEKKRTVLAAEESGRVTREPCQQRRRVDVKSARVRYSDDKTAWSVSIQWEGVVLVPFVQKTNRQNPIGNPDKNYRILGVDTRYSFVRLCYMNFLILYLERILIVFHLYSENKDLFRTFLTQI